MKKILTYLKSKRNLFTKQELLVGMEFGIVLSEVAKERGVTMTPEITKRAEKIFLNEIRINGIESTSCQFVPLVFACFEI